MNSPHILVVEDDPVIALDISQSVEHMGYKVRVAHTAGEAIQTAEGTKFDLALMDIKLGGPVDGISVAQQLQRRFSIPVIFLTAYADMETLKRSLPGAFAHLTKPVRVEELRAAIQIALRQHDELAQLLRSHEWLSALLGNITEGVMAIDLDGNIRYLNAQAESMTGWSLADAYGQPVEEILKLSLPEQQPLSDLRIRAVTDTRIGVPRQRFILHGRSGQSVPIEEAVTPLRAGDRFLGALSLLRDLSEALKLEQAQKWETVGVLAAGMSHDFNNLLTVVIGNLDLAMNGLKENRQATSLLSDSFAAAGKMAKLTSQLRAYAGKTIVQRQKVDCVAIVQSFADSLKAEMSRRITFSVDLPANCPSIEADPNQIQEVITNLVINAVEAIGRSRGSISLSASVAESNEGVFFRLQDTGQGMTDEVKSKIFDPFFSTKFLGRGLGLSAAQGIMRAHGGTISVETKPGNGSVFTLFFPSKAGRESL